MAILSKTFTFSNTIIGVRDFVVEQQLYETVKMLFKLNEIGIAVCWIGQGR